MKLKLFKILFKVDLNVNEECDSDLLRNLPRTPTPQEERLKFMIATKPNTNGEQAKYICLHCGKAYTSRYNIRCHLVIDKHLKLTSPKKLNVIHHYCRICTVVKMSIPVPFARESLPTSMCLIHTFEPTQEKGHFHVKSNENLNF